MKVGVNSTERTSSEATDFTRVRLEVPELNFHVYTEMLTHNMYITRVSSLFWCFDNVSLDQKVHYTETRGGTLGDLNYTPLLPFILLLFFVSTGDGRRPSVLKSSSSDAASRSLGQGSHTRTLLPRHPARRDLKFVRSDPLRLRLLGRLT